MAEKSEKATPKKLRDARKKGQVAKSQDFPSAFTFIVSISATIMLTGHLFQGLAGYIVSNFRLLQRGEVTASTVIHTLPEAILVIATTSFPILLFTVATGVLVNFLIVGPVFSAEVLKPDIKRLNPVTNVKNLFKMKTVIELLKSVLKIAIAVLLIYSVIKNSLGAIISTAALSPLHSAGVFSNFLIKVVIRVGIFFLAIAIFDLVYQRRVFAKQMMMEKFEVKQEFRDTEGDPQIKSRRMQTAREIAYQEGPQATSRARAVITNPIHIAVAIEYLAETEGAPKIVTMGQGTMADLILKYAQQFGVPIMRNVTLAHTLFEKGKIGDYIPEETYQAVAEILRWLESLEAIEGIGLAP